jgi:glutathione synthase/RimK-type ligase-like ATP-grasp enzyme
MASTIIAAALRSLVVAPHYLLRHADRHPRRHRPAALILNGEGLQLTADSHEPFVSGVETVFRQIDDIAFEVGGGRGARVYETIDGRDLADFGLVQVVTYPRPTGTLLNAITDYLRHHQVRAVNTAGVSAPNKLHQYLRFAQAGLAVPKTAYLPRRLLVQSYPDMVDRLGLPFVLKSISASGGKFNYLVGNEPDFASILRDPDHCAVHFLAQEFIPNDTTFRLLVLGHDHQLVMRQTSIGASYLENTVTGGRAELVDPGELAASARRLATRAALLIGCDIAAVNLIQHWTTGEWYILDANPTPAIATGAFVAEKLDAYSSYLRRRLTSS